MTEGNPYNARVGWRIIYPYLLSVARWGLGRVVFENTLAAARTAVLLATDATMGSGDTEGLMYYEAIGFREYQCDEDVICKAFWLIQMHQSL